MCQVCRYWGLAIRDNVHGEGCSIAELSISLGQSEQLLHESTWRHWCAPAEEVIRGFGQWGCAIKHVSSHRTLNCSWSVSICIRFQRRTWRELDPDGMWHVSNGGENGPLLSQHFRPDRVQWLTIELVNGAKLGRRMDCGWGRGFVFTHPGSEGATASRASTQSQPFANETTN